MVKVSKRFQERFRFRLPWLTSSTARPTAQPQRPRPPVGTTQAPAQQSTAVPVQPPPFRSPRIAPVPVQPSPPQSDQAPQPSKSEPSSTSPATIETPAAAAQPEPTSQEPSPPQIPAPPSPPHAPAESSIISQPASLLLASPQSRASVPPSPSRAATASGVTSQQPESPSRVAPQSRTSSVPPSPSQAATASEVTSQQPASPSRVPPQPRTSSVPPSPSRAITESRRGTQPASPSRRVPQSRAPSVPPSPSRTNLQPPSPSLQRAGKANSQTPSPSRKSPIMQQTASQTQSPLKGPQPTSPKTLLLPSISAQPPPSSSDQAAIEAIISDSHSELQKQIGTDQASNGRTMDSLLPETTVSTQRMEAKTVEIDLRASASEKEAKETEEEKKTKEDLITEGKTDSLATENEEKDAGKVVMLEGAAPESSMEGPEQPKITSNLEQDESKPAMLLSAAPESSMKDDLPQENASHSEQRVQVKEEAFERKRKLTTGSNVENLRSVRLIHSKANHLISGSHQSPVMLIGEDVSVHKEIKEDISKFVQNLGTGLPNQPGEMPISVVTLAGENRGAFMHISSEQSKTDGPIHIHRGYKANPDDSLEGTTADAEENSQKRSTGPLDKEDSSVQAFINSNAQSINNSLLFGSSITEGNPGVRMTITKNPSETPDSWVKLRPPSARKSEFVVTPAERLTYQPNVRRRCLRGLFMEPSDSDPDNPEKPRRHGCRYDCGHKNRDASIE